MNNSRGSIWRRWDLHIHTPFSYLNNSFGQSEDEYVQKLFKLAIEHEIAAIGIMDYYSIDGYKKIKEYLLDAEKMAALFTADEIVKINNILIVPNIEFRINVIVNDSKVNFHVLFSNEVSVRDIEEHFLHDIEFDYEGNPQGRSERRKLKLDNLRDLGQRLIQEHDTFKGQDNIVVGMANAFVEYGEIIEILQNNQTKFKDKYLIGVPSDEDLSGLNWNNQCHLSRKLLIQSSDFLFAANPNTIKWAIGNKSTSTDDFKKEFKTLKPCLHGSDAHDYDNLFKPDEDRYCWIKADPTWKGLRQILNEPSERVMIGLQPSVIDRVVSNPTRYIDSLTFSKNPESQLDELWFTENAPIKLNYELTAIIGNKGSGKSALSDTLGLLGNTIHCADFSFLTVSKFLDKKKVNRAKEFSAKLKWVSGKSDERKLDSVILPTDVETINCIPQNYIEHICSEKLEYEPFQAELEAVIFSHVPSDERLGETTLKSLILKKTKEKYNAITIARDELSSINKQIEKLEAELHPQKSQGFLNKLRLKQEEFTTHGQLKPPKMEPPKKETTVSEEKPNEIKELQGNLEKIDRAIAELKIKRQAMFEKCTSADMLLEKLNNIQTQVEQAKPECDKLAKELGLNLDDILTLTVKKTTIQKIRDDARKQWEATGTQLSEDEELMKKKKVLEEQIEQLKAKLDKPAREYEAFVKSMVVWEKKLKAINGDADTVDSLKYYEHLTSTEYRQEIDNQLSMIKENRKKKVEGIYNQLKALKDVYSQLYEPISKFIEKNPFGTGQLDMSFDVTIRMRNFVEKFFGFIAKNRKGSFYETGDVCLGSIITASDFNSLDSFSAFLERLENHLVVDKRDGFSDTEDKTRYVIDQLKQGAEPSAFYDFVYSLEYLKPDYELKWAGKSLSELSPGERGTLLLIFYLFIDKNDIPLVIDQPEANLDNETVYKILVPCIREAKKRRQLVVVTHNPNLAVVCDAEQIIHCDMKKQDKNRVTYTSGPIEKPIINKALIDILEGTRPAFDKRDDKYYV